MGGSQKLKYVSKIERGRFLLHVIIKTFYLKYKLNTYTLRILR